MHKSKLIQIRYIFIIFLLLMIGLVFRLNYDYRQLENVIDNEVNRLSKNIGLILKMQKQNSLYDGLINLESISMIGVQTQVMVKIKDEYSIVDTSPIFRILNSQIDLDKKEQIAEIDGKIYAIVSDFSLNSYSGYKAVKIIFAKDISEVVRKYKESLFLIYGINLIIILAVILLFLRLRKNMQYLQESLKELNITLENKVKRRTDEQNTLLSLFDNGDSVLFKWRNDDAWSVEFASLGVSELLGYTLEDITENKITYVSCIYEDDLDRVMLEVSEVSLSKESYFKHKPYRIVTKDGDIKWVLDYTIIVRDEDENITHYIGHLSNITQLKNIEAELLNKSRMAQMGEMISMIAHQWRQPLGAISAASIDLNMKFELEIFDLTTQEGREEASEYFCDSLKQIDSLVQNLTSTIDDFRNFYKPDKESKISLINPPVQKAFEILEASLKSNNIEIVQEYISKEELSIHSNELMQVVLNILKNAQDNFLEKEIIRAQIKIKTFDTSEASVIEICDNGGGISMDLIGKIFDPYFSTKNEKNGTGLGLYMSKIIIEEHHYGKIYAENIKNGVCFKIELFKK